MKPPQAAARQQQAQSRRNRLQEVEAAAQSEALRNPQLRQMQQAQLRSQYHASLAQGQGQGQGRRDPNRGIITNAEWDELVEKRKDEGKTFRYVLWLFVLAAMALLAMSKYDEEFQLEVPQVESGRGFGQILAPDAATPADSGPAGQEGLSKEELDEYYRILGVDGRLKDVVGAKEEAGAGVGVGVNSTEGAPTPTPVPEDPDKQRRRDNWRVRQELRSAYREHQEQTGQLVHCGRSCEAKNQQVEMAYNKLASQVDRELFAVLLDAEDTKAGRASTPREMKNKYEEKKNLILATEVDEDDRAMALEELRDAYEIIQSPEARKYYLLYGAKPPEQMRYVDPRHGGWGQEMALGTFKYRIIVAWLDFLHRTLGFWGETIVLGSVVVFFLSRLPVAIKQSQGFLDDLDWQDQVAEEAEAAQKAAAEAAAAAAK